ncbi:MAG: DUF4383 domain-containing protein [Candidatus Eremiobacteraeota bacterium]|nr:DUF4383 domain-containing protein [Candidatus Eremiobacteraeota bacterium]MBV8223518.1 DUF4383 domain-containing protein [Candidatus Eremiobacteraeota bacterium]
MAKTVALVFGIIYLLVGIAGFVPSIGGTLGMAPSVLLGLASINLIHNAVHLVIGFWGLAASTDLARAVSFCQTAGIVLVVLGLLGFFIPDGFGFVPLGGNDPWIHILSGLILALVGFMRQPATSRAR